MMNPEHVQRRIESTREQLARRHLDAVVLVKPVNVTYLTGFSGEDSWAILTKTGVYLLTDSRYSEQARKECVGVNIVERKELIAPAAGKLLPKLRSVRTAAIEDAVSVATYAILKRNAGIRLRTVGGTVEEQRAVKDQGELAAIRAAAEIATKAFRKAVRRVKPGMAESELAGILDLEMRRLGAKNAFETIVAFGPNASRPHHQPGPRTLRQTDTILIDFGARYNGYCSDITRSFSLGRPAPAWRRAYEVVKKAHDAAIEAARAGIELAKLDAVPRAVIRRSGLPVYGHGTGHGFGLEIHEAPFLREKVEGRLRAGQVITIEPGVYLPGRLGVRIEDDILITETGCEVLTTQCPHAPLPT